MSNCSHSELIRLTHELDIFASFLHKQSLGMELLGPPRLPYSPGGATVKPTDEKDKNVGTMLDLCQPQAHPPLITG